MAVAVTRRRIPNVLAFTVARKVAQRCKKGVAFHDALSAELDRRGIRVDADEFSCWCARVGQIMGQWSARLRKERKEREEAKVALQEFRLQEEIEEARRLEQLRRDDLVE